MNNLIMPATALLIGFAGVAFADGDAAEGEKDFKKCKACHTISSADEVFLKGGKTGPNLYGVIGRQAGSLEGFKYGASIVQAGADGLIWDEDTLVAYIADPKAFLKEVTGDSSAKSKMTFKLKEGEDVAEFLETFSPEMDEESSEASDS